jgi:hypothetical protein
VGWHLLRIAAQLKSERARIASDEAKKAKLEIGNDLEMKPKVIEIGS